MWHLFLQSADHIAVNVILALIPVGLAFAAAYVGAKPRISRALRVAIFVPLFFAWIAFLPNTCYLWTEWRHYVRTMEFLPYLAQFNDARTQQIKLLVYTAFFVAYTGFGLVTFFLSIRPLDALARRGLGRGAWMLQAALFQLCSLGVYLGLVDRFNSKDLIDPAAALRIWQSAADLSGRPLATTAIVLFGLLLWMIYFLCDIWMDGAALRLRRLRAG